MHAPPNSMCRECDRVAPICNWVQAVDFGDFCAGWGIRFRDIDPLPDEEEGKNVKENDNSGAGLQGSPEPTPKDTSKRIAFVRPGMTSLNPATPEERATWRYLGPNSPAHLYASQIQSWCQGRPKARPMYGTRVVPRYQMTRRSSSWRSSSSAIRGPSRSSLAGPQRFSSKSQT